jgi:acyl carrier protein
MARGLLRSRFMPVPETHVRKLLAEVVGVEPNALRATLPLVDYGLDSVRSVDLRSRIEDDFGIVVADDAFHVLRTLADVVSYVRSMLGEAEAS